MSQYNFDEKPKNDFDNYGKYKNDYQSIQRERGGCLSFFLGFIMVANIVGIFILFAIVGDVSSYGSNSGLVSLILYGTVALSIAAVVCAYGLWNWNEWGYNGLMIIYLISIIMNLISADFSGVGGSVGGMAILYYLMKDKTHYLD